MTGTKAYRTWKNMKTRCSSMKDVYKNYSGRGISVCEEWKNSFEKFYEDMGEPPTKNHTIERLNNDGDYCKANCVWATRITQVKNRRQQKFSSKYYRGVEPSGKRFMAKLQRQYLGTYRTKEEAAFAYNIEAIKMYGNKAVLNEVDI